jgi:hypothetical protein
VAELQLAGPGQVVAGLPHQGAVEEPVLAPLSESADLAGGREVVCSNSPP